jgi:endonuclease G
MRESCYYSKISPQVPAFNRGVWKRLEELLRLWATA